MKTFNPDLVVEVTSVCNRACPGCYAPNVVSNKSASELMKKDSSLFLSLQSLNETIMFWDQELPKVLSIRGGEPSLHPELPFILKSFRFFSREIVIETHGRWLLAKNRSSYEELIQTILEAGVVVKISYDSMHGLSGEELMEITDYLEFRGGKYLIAITESTTKEFEATRNTAMWIEDEKILYQKKAKGINELIKPRLGVINASGILTSDLNSKFPRNDSKTKSLILSEVAAG